MRSTAPRGLGPAGKALWVSVTAVYELEVVEKLALTSACIVADRVAALDVIVADEGVVLRDEKRGQIAHPALVESRQQRLVQARLLTALRLPDANDNVPQHRGIRGVYADRGADNTSTSKPRGGNRGATA